VLAALLAFPAAVLASFGQERRSFAADKMDVVRGSVRTREYEKDDITQRVFALHADSIGKLNRAECKQEGDVQPDGYDS
jgi:hypothetical protein